MKLRLYCLVIVTAVLVGQKTSAENCPSLPPDTCPLFPRSSDRVSKQNLIDKNIADGFIWPRLFGSEFDDEETYAKCLQKWTRVKDSDVVQRQTVCYNNDRGACETFHANVTWADDACGQVVESGVATNVTSRFYSQDPDQYLLFDVCYTDGVSDACIARYLDILVRGIRLDLATNVTSRFYSQDPDQYLLFDVCYTDGVSEACIARYLDILVRGIRLDDPSVNDVNLQHLPLHLIAIDLKENFNMDFSNNQLFYAWKGPECRFDGTIVTNSAQKCEFNIYALLLVTFVIVLT